MDGSKHAALGLALRIIFEDEMFYREDMTSPFLYATGKSKSSDRIPTCKLLGLLGKHLTGLAPKVMYFCNFQLAFHKCGVVRTYIGGLLLHV